MHKFLGTTRSSLTSCSSLSFKKIENGQKIVRSKGCDKKPRSRSLQEKIVDALFLGERSRASSLLLELGCGRSTLNANDFLYILQRCARLPDPLFFMETWKLMEEKEIEISRECYMFAVQALSRGGYLNEAFNLLNIVRDNPDTYYFLPIYNIFLGACVQMHSRPYVNQCLDLMDKNMVGKDEITYYQLLKKQDPRARVQDFVPALSPLSSNSPFSRSVGLFASKRSSSPSNFMLSRVEEETEEENGSSIFCLKG
ncbi:unnamed protein product [Cuscuta campestris]|uniref:Pentacotripeptide-repeat region of PRORP domain-containing protein n=1 Tax=Cuscuta campestris TaxID=132261 RepID=A0A484LFC7_9ASTE|nr:unnamed protein product [Cuscuta campestris]